jgi:hypothetical protein
MSARTLCFACSVRPRQDIKDFLHDEASKGAEVFEALGMKFPADKVTLWGIILILSVQLYFFVYLRQLSGRLRANDPGWDTPRVGRDTSGILAEESCLSRFSCPRLRLGGIGLSIFAQNARLAHIWRFKRLDKALCFHCRCSRSTRFGLSCRSFVDISPSNPVRRARRANPTVLLNTGAMNAASHRVYKQGPGKLRTALRTVDLRLTRISACLGGPRRLLG